MPGGCIRRDQNYIDNMLITCVILVAMVGMAVWFLVAWSREFGVVIMFLPIGISIVAMIFAAHYMDVIDARWRGIGYNDKMILSSGVRLSFDTRSYDDHKVIFEQHLKNENLEFVTIAVSIMRAKIIVTLKQDSDYPALIRCIDLAEREIASSIDAVKKINFEHNEEYKRLEQTVKEMDEKNNELYCKKY